MGLWRKVSRLREIAHHYSYEAEEWFSKYMKRHEENGITCGVTRTCRLNRHCPLSNIAGYHLAKGKIIYLWDFQSH